MKSLFYLLSVLAIGAAGFFGWTAKENYTEQINDRNALISANSKLSDSIKTEEDNKAQATDAKGLALDEMASVEAGLEATVAKEKETQRTLDEYTAKLEEMKAEEKLVDDGIEAVKALFPGIELEEVSAKVKALRETEKKLASDLADEEDFKARLTKEVSKNSSDIVRVTGKVKESVDNINRNTFQATVTAVDNRWDFVIIGAGEKSGLTVDTKLLVVRGGKLIGKLSIHELEANRAVADISPGSVKIGSSLRAGDQVILEKVRSN